ncbi:MAG: helix-turn-helix transcriptional regulator [Caldilineaceae bacterium]|nr:helix-turn-helix transcriptional regulator [Caldilineaceae bacterium]
MKVQIIEKNGQIEWAVIPYAEYQRLLEASEMLADIQAYDLAKAEIDAGEELIPSTVVYRLLDGENPIRVWREHRGLTQQQVADQAGISKPYLSQLESGKRQGRIDMLQKIAQVLVVSLEDLVID